MKYLFVGHEDFGNRGCEALIRSITAILADRDPVAEFMCPSKNPSRDERHWPDAGGSKVRFVAPSVFPWKVRWWGRLARRVKPVAAMWPRPRFTPDARTRACIDEADAIIVTGGDILGPEYGLESLYHWLGVIDRAIDRGKAAHLWAASVGPFTADPMAEWQVAKHLARYASISVRETSTRDYLRSLGLPNVSLVADPAFTLEPQPHSHGDALFVAARGGVLGFNISPLVRCFLPDEAARRRFDEDLAAFLRFVIDETDVSVLLIPHVDPFDGSAWNSDSIYMQSLLESAGGQSARMDILPPVLNAAQLKYALGRCRFFMGARTHATIGALSLGVPTISIAYSVKARGINRDLFGNEDCVLPTPQVTQTSLQAALNQLLAQENQIRDLLARQIPVWRERARHAADLIRT